MADRDGENRTFTSWKLDLLDAMSMDPRVTGSEFRVAFRLLQHANSETLAIFPSQDRIASQTGMKERTVRACVAGIVKKGWLHKSRSNRRVSNSYRFDTKHVNAILDRQIILNEARREERIGRSKPSDRQSDAVQTSMTGIMLPIVSGIQVPDNTLTLHLKNKGIEEGSYLTAFNNDCGSPQANVIILEPKKNRPPKKSAGGS